MSNHPITLPGNMHVLLRRFLGVGVCLLLALCFAGGGVALPAVQAQTSEGDAPGRIVPTELRASMPVEDVRIGMKGYGLTVFHGTKIEPFPVEVVSIVRNAGPQRHVIWIRSEDPRLLESGPVQGMSGSPIYLWQEGEAQSLGEGGRLIGAFAYGFSLSKGCLAGVQPIDYMRQVGRRANEQAGPPPAQRVETEPTRAPAHVGLAAAQRSLDRLAKLPAEREAEDAAPRLAAWQTLLDPARLNERNADRTESDSPAATALPPGPRDGFQDAGRVVPLLLPMSVGSPEIAELIAPLLEPMGISPVAASQGFVSGAPPQSVDVEAAALQPGSVLSVPLAFGDLDLAAGGTVTEVLPDGTVLGFGHAMFGEGQTALPMATGFVHFVVPRLNQSFKLAGSLNIHGSLQRDEVTAVAGNGERSFTTAPVSVNVQMPGQPAEQYNYEIVDHQSLTPSLASTVTMRSLTARHNPPMETTLMLRGEMRFTGGRTLQVDTLMPGEQMMGVMMELTPPIMLAMQNPHQRLALQSMDVSAEVIPGRRTATIINARLDRAEVAPGETVGVTVWIQPYAQPPKRLRTTIAVPANLPDGDYPLMISDAQVYLAMMMDSRPHLFTTRNVDELMGMMQRVLSVKRSAVHLVMQLPEEGIAVGRQELPQLPSSRRAMIFTPTSTVAHPYMETVEQTIDTDMAITGQRMFTVHVRNHRTRTQPPPGEQNQ